MSVHYTYLDEIAPQIVDGVHLENITNAHKIGMAAAVALIFIVVGRVLAGKILATGGAKDNVIPSKKITLFGFVDFIFESFVKFHDSILGKENRKHLPFVASIFFLLLVLNLLGLVPGMPAATTTVWLNVSIAMVVFIYFNGKGIMEHGLINYLKHFAGGDTLFSQNIIIVLLIAPLLFCLEIFSTCLRVVTLNLRLYWNITADHNVLGAFSDLLSSTYVMAAPFYVLGVFVSIMQALIFTILTMIYILLATQHDEEGH